MTLIKPKIKSLISETQTFFHNKTSPPLFIRFMTNFDRGIKIGARFTQILTQKNLLQNPVNECNFLIIYMGINQKQFASCDRKLFAVFFCLLFNKPAPLVQ